MSTGVGRGQQIPGGRVKGGCEQPDLSAGNQARPLSKHSVCSQLLSYLSSLPNSIPKLIF